MKNFIVLFVIFSFLELNAQSTIQDFKISEPNVSRKDMLTIDRATVTIKRESENREEDNGDIKLTKTKSNGEVLWSKYYGGSGYEYIGSFLETKDRGFLIVGTTSSFGEGNNNVYLIRTDQEGNELWSKTYGGFFNEYGYYVKEEANGNLLIKGKKQFCKGENVGSGCVDKSWVIRTNSDGEFLGEKISDLTARRI